VGRGPAGPRRATTGSRIALVRPRVTPAARSPAVATDHRATIAAYEAKLAEIKEYL